MLKFNPFVILFFLTARAPAFAQEPTPHQLDEDIMRRIATRIMSQGTCSLYSGCSGIRGMSSSFEIIVLDESRLHVPTLNHVYDGTIEE